MKSEPVDIEPGTRAQTGGGLPPPSAHAASRRARDLDDGPRILLIVQDGTGRDLYRRVIGRTGARVDTVAAIADFQGAVAQKAYNGIVVDIPTKIQALNRHKDLINSILDRFPVIQVNQEKTTGRIRALLYGQHERQGDLQDLIRDTCLSRPPRRFRANPRCDAHFNVLLARTRDFAMGNTERSVTLNISRGGCFIITTARHQIGQRVWIRIMEMDDKTPIACEVIHKRTWCQAMAIPGIGVRFETLTDDQQQALARRCEPLLPTEGTSGRP